MADTEDNRTITEPCDRTEPEPASQSQQPEQQGSVEVPPVDSGAELAAVLQDCPGEQSLLVGADLAELADTTIIYVQPDGSLLGGSGLTAEEQQAVLDQITQHQVIQVSDTEAAQLLQHSQLVKTVPVQNAALDQNQLQQVINQVTKAQSQVHVSPKQQVSLKQPVQAPVKQQVQIPLKPQVQVSQQSLKPSNQNNASQQLKNVAQQVALQTSTSVQVGQE